MKSLFLFAPVGLARLLHGGGLENVSWTATVHSLRANHSSYMSLFTWLDGSLCTP
jgi:hypothetical protein